MTFLDRSKLTVFALDLDVVVLCLRVEGVAVFFSSSLSWLLSMESCKRKAFNAILPFVLWHEVLVQQLDLISVARLI